MSKKPNILLVLTGGIICIANFLLFSNCSVKTFRFPFYELNKIEVSFLKEDFNEHCPCTFYKIADGLNDFDKLGLQIKSNTDFLRIARDSTLVYGREYQPGYDGPIKKITGMSVALSNSTESLEISDLLSYEQTYIDNSNNKYDKKIASI